MLQRYCRGDARERCNTAMEIVGWKGQREEEEKWRDLPLGRMKSDGGFGARFADARLLPLLFCGPSRSAECSYIICAVVAVASTLSPLRALFSSRLLAAVFRRGPTPLEAHGRQGTYKLPAPFALSCSRVVKRVRRNAEIISPSVQLR